MPEQCTISINGASVSVDRSSTVAAAMLNSGHVVFRRSVSGEARGPLCGMGVCFECRVTIDGVPHARSCQVLCSEGMRIESAD